MPAIADLLAYIGGEVFQKYGVAVRRTATWEENPETFTRDAGPAYYRARDGYFRASEANQLRVEWLDLDGDGILETPVLLLEDKRTNELTDSCDFQGSGASDWTDAGDMAISPVTSVILGQTAYKHVNDGLGSGRSRWQAAGTLTGSPETASTIIENVDAVESTLGIYDFTAGGFVAEGTFTWATEAFVEDGAGQGSATAYRVKQLAVSGPNGGAVYRLTVTGTPDNSGNARRVYIYPTGHYTTNSLSAIIHHAGHEEAAFASSIIVTTTAADAREAETLSIPFNAPSQVISVYLKLVEAGTIIGANFSTQLFIGAADGLTDPRIAIRKKSGSNVYEGLHDNGTSSIQPFLATTPSIGDVVELLLTSSGTGNITITQSINGGVPTTGTGTDVAHDGSAWGGGANLLYLNSLGAANRGFTRVIGAKVIRGLPTLDEARELGA